MTRPALIVSLDLAGRRVVLVGAGELADERAARLTDAGAALERIAPPDWRSELASGAWLVLAHSDDRDLDRRIAADARAAGALAYAHDQPDISDVGLPALARRGSLSIAIATDGVAPALARRVRMEIERLLDDAGPAIDALIGELERRRAELPSGPERVAELRRLADRLRIDGRLTVDED